MWKSGSREARRQILRIRVLTLISLLAIWEAIRASGLVFEGVMPSTLEILQAIGIEIGEGTFYHDLGITLLGASLGFVIGSVAGTAIGIVLGVSDYIRRMVEPYLIAIGSTPKIIFLPILFLLFGLGLESKIAKGAMSAFFPVVLSATYGYLQVPKVLLRVGRSFRLTLWQTIWKIYLPAMATPLIAGMRLGMAMSIIGVLAAEITYSDAGLGYRLIRYADQFEMASVYAVTILIFVVSSMINSGMLLLQSTLAQHGGRQKIESRGYEARATIHAE